MQSDSLDVVIGVVFVWFLLSGLLSVVNEGFSLVTHARAKHLWLGIGRLIDPQRSPLPRRLWDITVRLPFSGKLDLRPRAEVAGAPPAAAAGEPEGWWQRQTGRMTERPKTKTPDLADLRSDLQTVYVAMAPQLVEVAKPGRLSKLSNIPAAAVSEALTRWVSPVHRAELLGAARRLQWSGEDRAKLEALLADVGDDEVVELDDLLDRDGTGLPGPTVPESALRAVHDEATVRLGLADLTGRLEANPELAAALRRAVATAQGHERVVAARRVVEQWFDHEMAQLTVFYRRQARKVMALLAVPVVVLFHANAIALVQDLHDDAVLRQAVVNEAVTAGAAESLDEAVRQSCSTAAPEAPSDSDGEDPVAAATDQLACARRIVDDAAPLSVGLSWDDLKAAHGDPDRFEGGDVWPYLRDDWGLVGRGLTLVALLFGAQFWFDVLRRLVGFRRPAPAPTA